MPVLVEQAATEQGGRADPSKSDTPPHRARWPSPDLPALVTWTPVAVGARRAPLYSTWKPTGCWVGAECGHGRHEAGDWPIGSCLVVGVTDQTGVVTTIVCLFVTIQRVA
jgi:hypothetical protein